MGEVRLDLARQRLARLQGEQPKAKQEPKPAGSKSSEFAREQLAVVDEMDRLRREALRQGQKLAPSADMENGYLWSRRRMDAQRELSEKKADEIAAVEAHLARMKELEEQARKLAAAQQASLIDVLAGRFYRLEAERWLAQARGKEAGKAHDHAGWWCDEHGLSEEMCSLCSAKVAAECKKKGNWCDKHDRAKSQCFLCDPKLKEKFATLYRAKYGKEPPPIAEEEETPKKQEKQ